MTIKINVKTKYGYQYRNINENNIVNYRKTKYGYSKKSNIQILKIHEKIIEKRLQLRYKKKLIEIKEYQKEKRIFKKLKRKEKIIEKLLINYETKNHKGYINSKKVNIFITDETTESEHEEKLKIIVLTINYYLIPIPYRQNYVKIHYTINMEGFQQDDSKHESSSITTHIKFDIDALIHETKQIYYDLVNLLHQNRSPVSILIYQVDYINYDFKSYING